MTTHLQQPGPAFRHCALVRAGMRTVSMALVCLIVALAGLATSGRAQDVPSGFRAETVVTGINAATALAIAPDGRVFFAEQTGQIRVFKDGRLQAEPALDLGPRLDTYWERGLIGLTLHPEFPVSPYIFVVYVAKDPFTHHVVSRFTVTGNTIDLSTEHILLEGDDQSTLGGFKPSGHQGGPIVIGPDGKVYVGLGEQTAGQPSQQLDTLIGKILRINQDGSVPADNPFLDRTTGKYQSIWAYGIRNPFGLAFDPTTERLWETDVGQTSWEEVNIIVKGGNYGWPDAEGESGHTDFINPVHAYPPAIGRSIVGGMFYPLSAAQQSPLTPPPATGLFPEKWRGRFFFGDWANHWIKALNPDPPQDVITFARNLNGPVALQWAPDGSLYVLNRGTIWRDPAKFVEHSGSLVHIRYQGYDSGRGLATSPPHPSTLADTGWFERLDPLTPSEQFTPFEINHAPWQPGVTLRQWLALPEGAAISIRKDGEWNFPTNAVVIQHYTIDGGPRQGAPFETRVLRFNEARTVRAAAYRWGEEGHVTTLIEDAEFTTVPGQPETYWFSPGAEFNLNLDQVVTGFTLPLNTRQANRDDQLGSWNQQGWFSPPLGGVDRLNQLAAMDDVAAPLETRIRSFMDVNCSACHRPGGSSRGEFDARFTTPIGEQGLINGQLIAGDLGLDGARVVVPGRPEKSILLQRVSRTDFYRMPPVTFSDEPSPIVPLLEEWIRSMPITSQASAPSDGTAP